MPRPHVVAHGNIVGRLAKAIWRCDRCGAWHEEKPYPCRDRTCGNTTFTRFASKDEARRYSELLLQETAGHIKDLELQPRYPLLVVPPEGKPVKIGEYRPDFRYHDCLKDAQVIEDVKGRADTFMSKWKRRHAEAQYGVEITVIWS